MTYQMNSLILKRAFSLSQKCLSDFSHVIVGGGCVGTAIARELQQVSGNSVALLDQHEMLGMETTSRNSEVIHAGLYYPPDSLKARFCLRGKELIYTTLDSKVVPYQQCGKWVVAQTEKEGEYLEKLTQNAALLNVPTELILRKKANETHPMIRAEFGALESPTTGIISAHDLVSYCNAEFENAGGTVGLHTKVLDIEYEEPLLRYVLHCVVPDSQEPFTLTADNIVNSAGLFAPKIANMLLPEDRKVQGYFAKGNYFSFAPSEPISTSKVTSKLIYPCPNPNASSLGTHLTFDLGGQLRFGPDLEWLSVTDADDINYDVSAENLKQALEAINTYLPSVKLEDLQPSYSGVRPKLVSQNDNKRKFADFYVDEEQGFKGFVNLMGIESPGLTSALAIGEYVRGLYHS